MFSRTSVAFLLPLLCAAALLAGCTAAISTLTESGSGVMKGAQDLEKTIGETVGRVQSGATLILDGAKQMGSGATKIQQGKSLILGSGSGSVK